MKTNEIRDSIGADTIGQSKGVYTVRRGFFYTHGYTAEKMVEAVKHFVPNAVIVDSGEIWKNFRGGDSVAQGSHFFVKFSILTN